MEIDDIPKIGEEGNIAKRQWIAFIISIVIFPFAGFLTAYLFDIGRYLFLIVCLPLIYIGASSIKNRVSIFKFSGQSGYSRGVRALRIGLIIIALPLIYIAIVALTLPFWERQLPI